MAKTNSTKKETSKPQIQPSEKGKSGGLHESRGTGPRTPKS